MTKTTINSEINLVNVLAVLRKNLEIFLASTRKNINIYFGRLFLIVLLIIFSFFTS